MLENMQPKKINSGFLIAIEGIDGSGKSSVALTLKDALLHKGFNVTLTKEPGGTPLGVQIRSLLQHRSVEICSEAEFLLFAADRAQHIQQLIVPQLASGAIVISDRMADSSLAYQGFGRGLDKSFISQVNSWAMKGRMPDLVIYIRIDYQAAFERLKRRHKLTAFEQEQAEFFKRVIDGFETIFKDRNNMIILDGTVPLYEVKEQAIMQVMAKISAKLSGA